MDQQGLKKSQDYIPFHFYIKLLVRVDAVQVFTEVFSVVAVQPSVKLLFLVSGDIN